VKLSLWLEVPALQPVVDALAREVGNPPFVPHLTLQGNVPHDLDLSAVAAPDELTLSSFGTQGVATRFFCLVADAAPTLPEWPHVSLLYGTDAARSRWPDPMAVAVRFGSSLFGRYDVAAVSLWATDGPVEEWRLVRRR
jgi:hypothetical protein